MADYREVSSDTLVQELKRREAVRAFEGRGDSAVASVGKEADTRNQMIRSTVARDGCEKDNGMLFGSAGPQGLTLQNVEDAFRYHPWHQGQADRGDQVREALVGAAKAILRNVPAGADRDAALRKLREARMDANSAITHDGRF